MRSLRQWPNFETITRSRCGLPSLMVKSMANSAAMGAKAELRPSTSWWLSPFSWWMSEPRVKAVRR
ncbi:hypothetical protein D3C85_1862100 [compost metagenome]